MNLKEIVAEVRSIATKAQALFTELKQSASQGKPATNNQLQQLSKLIDEAEATRQPLRDAAAIQRDDRIKDLRGLVAAYEAGLAMPGFDDTTREILQSGLEKAQADLASLLAEVGTDFGGLLTPDDVQRIRLLIQQARREVAAKSNAAAVAAVTISVADLALDVATKLAKAAV